MKIIETNLKFKSNYSFRSGDPDGLVLHHAASNGSVYDVHNWHLALGWAGIGYHFYVRKDGSVYRGRPEKWLGSHTSGHNSKIGICAEGNFDEEQMSTAQKNAIIELLAYLYGKYGKLKVYGHRDLDATACPGKNYPFADIVNGKKEADTSSNDTIPAERYKPTVKEWQNAAVADGFQFPQFGADGIWGDECASVAMKAVCKRRDAYTYPNLTKIIQRIVGVEPDGLYGPDTEAAVSQWMWKHILEVS